MREKSRWLRICIFSEFSTFACIWQIWQICRANIVFTYVNDNYQPHYKFCWMRLNMSTCLIHPTNNEPATVAKCSISNDGILQILRRFSYLNVTVGYHENESDRTLTTKCHTQKPAQTQTIRVMPNHKGYITSDFMSCKWHDSSLNIGFLFEHLVDLPDCQWKSLRNVLNGFDDLSCGCNKHDTLLWASKIIVWWFYDACGTHDKKIGNSLWVFNWRFGIRINIETFDEG